jgi:hypothetical protein
MPKELATDLETRIESEVARQPNGISAGALARKFANEASRRSIARIIQTLLRRKSIVVEGQARSTRYRAANARITATVAASEENDVANATGEVYVPLSPEGEKVRSWVRAPITQRRPVGYDRAFLDAYRPNETFYLSDRERRDWLNRIGSTALGERPAGTYARDILNRLLIDLSWASSRLEGNTYTRLDTQQLIETGRQAEGKDQIETQMILNHKRAIEFLIEQAQDIGFTRFTLLNLHSLLSENLLADPDAGGRLRSRIVDIQGTVFRPLAMPQKIEELFEQFLNKAAAIHDPFEQAFFAMVHIPYLQPFEDVNKRVSRLAANIPLIKSNLCPLSFIDVPEQAYVEGLLAIYERTHVGLLRDVFLWAYERSSQQFRAIASGMPKPDPFRMKYRLELGEAVAEIVRDGLSIDFDVEKVSEKLVPREERKRFETMVREELSKLHEGNIARYGIRISEFRDWIRDRA